MGAAQNGSLLFLYLPIDMQMLQGMMICHLISGCDTQNLHL